MSRQYIQTVTGQVAADEFGLILPHEHLFTDLRGPTVPGYAQGNPEVVAQVMEPYLVEAHAAGVTALVECSTLGVGRNVPVLKYLAHSTPVRIIAPTGVYRQAYIPPELIGVSAKQLAEMWIGDLTQGMEGSDVKAGFIKIAMSDDGPTDLEVRNLKAAAAASQATGAVIASHTIRGDIAMKEMDILESEGINLDRFIWVHANAEVDQSYHRTAVSRGAYVEFDAIGQKGASQDELLNFTLAVIEAGYANRILLSHDAGWYDPSQPDGRPVGDGIRGFTALIHEFIPALRKHGLSEDMIRQLTMTNPAGAFALKT